MKTGANLRNAYYMLVSSLPHMPAHFQVERAPINRIRLEERLRMLEPEDAHVVAQMEAFFRWDRQPRERTDEEAAAHYEALMAAVTNPLVRHIIRFRMEMRIIMSALRRRRRGMPPPAVGGHLADQIRRSWSQPEFNLDRVRPWVGEVARLLDEGDPLEVEARLFEVAWTEWRRLAAEHFFSFEAIILYLARWEIVDRWTRLDPALGRRRFQALVSEATDAHEFSGR